MQEETESNSKGVKDPGEKQEKKPLANLGYSWLKKTKLIF